MPSATCAALNQIFVEEAGRIGPEIFRRTNTNNAWNGLVKQGEFPSGMGAILTSLTYGRGTLAAPVTFTPLASSQTLTPSDSYVNANIPFQLIQVPKSKLQYQLQSARFKSDDIALEDLRTAFEVKEQISNQLMALEETVTSIFTDYRRSEYTRVAGHKMIANQSLTEDPTNFPTIAPQSGITQKILDVIYRRLNRDGAQTYAYAKSSGKPVYMVILSSEQHEKIIRENPTIRQDFHFSGDAGKLLAPMGVADSYKGWFHMIDDFTPRYDLVGGAWVQRPVFDSNGEVSALYESAGYEDVIVYMESVFTELVPTVMNSVGKMVYKYPNSYRGEWFWLNIPDRVCNPFENVGFFASVITTATKPNLPKHGYVIRVQRCPLDIDPIVCGYGSGQPPLYS